MKMPMDYAWYLVNKSVLSEIKNANFFHHKHDDKYLSIICLVNFFQYFLQPMIIFVP